MVADVSGQSDELLRQHVMYSYCLAAVGTPVHKDRS